MKASISKETFCKALLLIKEQEAIHSQFSKAIELVGNGHYVFGSPNLYLDAALLVLTEAVGDKYEYIDWWLFELKDDYIIKMADGSKTWDLSTPEALYDYIVNECN